MVVKSGRFGEYVTDGEYNATLRKDDTVEAITLERAAELLAERRERGPAKKAAKKGAKKAPAKKTAKKTTKKATRQEVVRPTGSQEYREITDEVRMRRTPRSAGPHCPAGGGRFLARRCLEKRHDRRAVGTLTVVIEFESVEAAQAAHDSPAYRRPWPRSATARCETSDRASARPGPNPTKTTWR